jgi:starvation-inducible DNA-binding protein
MTEVVESAKKVLGNVFVMYMKAHSYHWNYIGPEFPQYHTFFGNLYDELHDSVDTIAEQIRALDGFAPGSLTRMVELSTITEDVQIPTPKKMFQNLYDANEEVIASMTESYNLANEDKELGYSNFLQDRIDIHKKYRWMLKATMGQK